MKSCITISLVEEARGGPFVLWDGLESSIHFAAELGYDAVEVFAPGPETIDIDALGKLLEATGLKLAALGTGAGWVKHRLQLADTDASKREQAKAFVRSIIDAAGPLGASAIIGSMQGPSGHTPDATTARNYLIEALEDGAAHAARYQVPLIYEPLNRYETRQCCTVADGVALLESLSTDPNVDAIVIVAMTVSAAPGFNIIEVLQNYAEKGIKKPTVICGLRDEEGLKQLATLESKGLITYPSIRRAVRALAAAYSRYQYLNK